jgi:esterase
MATPASRLVSVGGLRLHYLEWGNADARPLVLLHDLGHSADAWRPVAPALAERFHVLAVDLRGHGDSDWIDTYAPQEQGDDIGELLGTLGLVPATLMGAGMGGRAALLLAARQEHAVARVVAVDVGVRMYLPPEREADEAVMAMPRVYDSPAEFNRAWWALRHALGLTRHAAPPDDSAGEEAARLVRPLPAGGFAPRFDADGYQRYRAWSPGGRVVDYDDEFSQISCPVLLVRGADSPLLSVEEARATVAVIPDCRLTEVPGARHDVLADNPAGLLERVQPFLCART